MNATERECEYKRVHGIHIYTVRLSIPRKSMGAVTGYDPYRACGECGDRIPESVFMDRMQAGAEHLSRMLGEAFGL